MNILLAEGQGSLWTFFFVSLLLGGAASMASGRALAATWRPIWQCAVYGAFIALTAAFLHYALFQESVVAIYALGQAIASFSEAPAAALGQFIANLRGAAILFVLQTLFVLAGYWLTRSRQMQRQYAFAADGRHAAAENAVR